MTIYQYHVSALPEDWEDGRVFANYKDAEEHAQSIGGCVTEVTRFLGISTGRPFSSASNQQLWINGDLVWDGRDACDCNRSCVCE